MQTMPVNSLFRRTLEHARQEEQRKRLEKEAKQRHSTEQNETQGRALGAYGKRRELAEAKVLVPSSAVSNAPRTAGGNAPVDTFAAVKLLASVCALWACLMSFS